jgi:hypothetical protein
VRSLSRGDAAPARRAPPRRTPLTDVQQLQRALGNRGMRALLRDVKAAHPTKMDKRRGEFPQLTRAFPAGGMDDKTWRDTVADAKAALTAGRKEDAIALYTKLYQDLAAAAGAAALRDVGKSLSINVAKADDTGYAPGLNLVLGSGGATGGSTAFVDAGGKFGATLSAGKGAKPHIAIRLWSSSLGPDRAAALGVLRHEMLHAHHHEQALDALAKKGHKPSGVDKVLVDEITAGGSANTEVLAYAEGFMTMFHLLDPPPKDPRHPIYVELLGVLETKRIWPWKSADPAVRDEALGRLREYYLHTLDAAHQAAFADWVNAQAAQADKDAGALKAGTDAGAVQTAKGHRDNMFEHFVRGLQEVIAAQPQKMHAEAREKARHIVERAGHK